MCTNLTYATHVRETLVTHRIVYRRTLPRQMMCHGAPFTSPSSALLPAGRATPLGALRGNLSELQQLILAPRCTKRTTQALENLDVPESGLISLRLVLNRACAHHGAPFERCIYALRTRQPQFA
jgi:hypothetical protein